MGKKDREALVTDIILEALRAIVVGSIFVAMLRVVRAEEVRALPGWRPFLAGFGLIFLGSLVDITDNFESLNRFVVIGDTDGQAFLEKVVGYLLGFVLIAIGVWTWLPKMIAHKKRIAEDLQKAEEEVEELHGLLPICAHCKKVRDDKGYWNQIEKYISERSEADFSHSICPGCMQKHFPHAYENILKKRAKEKAANLN